MISREAATAAAQNKLLSPLRGSGGSRSYYPMLTHGAICFRHFVVRKPQLQNLRVGLPKNQSLPHKKMQSTSVSNYRQLSHAVPYRTQQV
jgi:hypothetical protein